MRLRRALLTSGVLAALCAPAVAGPVRHWVWEKTKEKAEEGALVVLDATTGPVGVGVYKAIDLAHDLGDAAVEADDRSHGADVIAVNRDLAVLMTLARQGVNLDTSPTAKAAKYHLKMLGDRMSAQDFTTTDYLLITFIRNQRYAVDKVAWDKVVVATAGESAGELGRRLPLGKWLARHMPGGKWLGDKASKVLGKKTGEALAKQGWTLLADRAHDAEPYVDRYEAAARSGREAPRDVARQAINDVLDEAETRTMEDLYREVAPQHPATPAAIRVAMVTAALALAPRPAVPAPLPPTPVPAPLPPPTYVRGNLYVDPMAHAIYVENAIERAERRAEQRTANPSSTDAAPAAPPEDTSWHPSPELVHERECQGAGPMAGCEKYTSSSGAASSTVTYQGTRVTPNE